MRQAALCRCCPGGRLLVSRPDAVAAEHDSERHRRWTLYASTTLDKMVVINGELDAIGGAIVTGELRRLERQLYLAG